MLTFLLIAHKDSESVLRTAFVGTSPCQSILQLEGNGFFQIFILFSQYKVTCTLCLPPFCSKFFEAWNSLPVVSYTQELMNGYQFIADNNLATNRNACLSSLCRIFALRQCLISGCRFKNAITGCAFSQNYTTETFSSHAILSHSVSKTFLSFEMPPILPQTHSSFK